jgi:hypothetical protein
LANHNSSNNNSHKALAHLGHRHNRNNPSSKLGACLVEPLLVLLQPNLLLLLRHLAVLVSVFSFMIMDDTELLLGTGTGAFGGGAFGQQNQQQQPQQQPAGSLFGQQQPASTGFGAFGESSRALSHSYIKCFGQVQMLPNHLYLGPHSQRLLSQLQLGSVPLVPLNNRTSSPRLSNLPYSVILVLVAGCLETTITSSNSLSSLLETHVRGPISHIFKY